MKNCLHRKILYGDGYVLIGFSDGYFISISTHAREIGQELFQSKNHKECLTDMALSTAAGKLATCGDNCIKIHGVDNLAETINVITIDDDQGIDQLAWSEDGQLLAASTTYGSVHVYLAKLPMLASAHLNYMCMLTSLSQITVNCCSFDKDRRIDSVVVETEIDPSFLCIGPYHLAVGMNNRIWFYELVHESSDEEHVSLLKIPRFLLDREYLGTISNVQLNGEYVSVLFEGRIHLHLVDSTSQVNGNGNEKEMKIFPDSNEKYHITSQHLTTEFLIYATNNGHIKYFCLDEWKIAVDYQHVVAVKSIYPNHDGVRCIFIDSKSEGYLYNPVNDTTLKIMNFPSGATGVLWELWHEEKHIFMIFDVRSAYIFTCFNDSINGPGVRLVGESKLPAFNMPLLLHRGELYTETASGNLNHSLLSTHQVSASFMKKDEKHGLEDSLDKHLGLLRYTEAIEICKILDDKKSWIKLATSALTYFNIDKAIEIYGYLDDIGMVLTLKNLKFVEDKQLLAGKICAILENFDKAQDLYLESTDPVQALYLRQDLLQWDMALQLAKNLAPDHVPKISREYGSQLELTGRYLEALQHYERALADTEGQDAKHISSCYAGIARTSIRNGDYQRGLKIATSSNATKQLKNECAELFENVKKLNEAALLYEEAENYNQTAVCYIRLKNWTKVGSILSRVSSAKIYSQYAKAMEAIGNHRKAVEAYQLSRDYTNTIRLTLDRLNDPQEAVRIVQETRSIDGAKMVAKYFQKTGDILSAIKFLIMSACYDEAFNLAKENDQLQLYGDVLVDESIEDENIQEFLSLAEYFEKSGKSVLAGKYYFHGKQYRKALKLLFDVARDHPDNEDVLSLAIDVVAASNEDNLSNQLVHLLLGEIDGVPRNPKFIFRLYMARKEYKAAAKTAVIISTEEQINGNYKRARDILFNMAVELKLNNLKISAEMMSSLMLLHSYVLVKIHVKRNDHIKAAILLIRVADNMSKFPAHIVPILTSAVIECHRANMRRSAFLFASMLMKPEYRNQVDAKYRKKIEAVIRKSPKGELNDDVVIESTPCPYCDNLLSNNQLSCSNCRSTVPFCVITGWHVTRDNLTVCPNCQFPALYSEFIELLKTSDYCPLCSEKINKSHLQLITIDPLSYLRQDGAE